MKAIPRLAAVLGLIGATALSGSALAGGDGPWSCQALTCLGGALQGSPSIGYGGGKCNVEGTDYFFHWCGYVCILMPKEGPCLKWKWNKDVQRDSCRYPYVKSCTVGEGAYRDDNSLAAEEPGNYLNWPEMIRRSTYATSKCQYLWAEGHTPSIHGGGHCCPTYLGTEGSSCWLNPMK